MSSFLCSGEVEKAGGGDESQPHKVFPRKWMLPGLPATDRLFHSLGLYHGTKDPEVVRVLDTDEQLEVTLDMSKYRPEELSVRVEKEQGCVLVEGRHVEGKGEGKAAAMFQRR
jgi:HSP20 family molecular chaperone IbpA